MRSRSVPGLKPVTLTRRAQDAGPTAPPTPEPVAAEPEQAGPAFASPQAEALADEFGLDLTDEEPTGANGFTVADIRRIVGET